MPGPLVVACPSCGASSRNVPARLAGHVVRCPRCQARFTVPVPAGEPQPTVPEVDLPVAPSAGGGHAPVAPTVPEAPPAAATATPEWRPGQLVLGLYEVIGVLGHGGMGRVYRVRHRGWGLDLALKVPLPQMLAAAGGADLFQREAETWVNLGLHPHVVTCHYVRRLDGLPLVFAEYADGGSLHEAIRQGRLTSVEEILDLAVQFAWGLHHAHEQGLVHRDVKPANVMLTSDGLAKVTDFGLARARSVRLSHATEGAAGHTMTVEGGGGATPAYVSPEQARGEPLSRRSDAWSFGLSVLEMFLGGRTWDLGLAAPAVLEASLFAPAQGRPELPPRVAGLLARCFRESPDERPHDLAEIADDLRAAWEAVSGRPYPRAEPTSGRGSADALNNRAASLVDLGRAHEATGLWSRALEAEPLHLEASYNAAVHAWAQARIADAELRRRVEEACNSRPGSARAGELLARVEALLGPPAPVGERTAVRAIDGAPVHTLRGLAGTVTSLTTTPDGSLVLAAADREVRAWRALDGEPVQTLTVAQGTVHALLALADGRSVLVAAEGAPLTVWDLSSRRPLRTFARHAGFPTSLAHALAGTRVLSGGSDRVVRLWDPASGACTLELAGHEDAVTAVAAGDTVLASASRDGSVRIWSPSDGSCLGVLRGHQGRVLAVALRESELRVVSAGDDGTVVDWGLRSRQIVRTYVSHTLAVPALLLTPDGTRFVSGGTDRSLRGFEPESERLAFVCRLDAAVQALAWGGDGTIWVAHGASVTGLRPTPIELPRTALCRPASASEENARSESFAAHVASAQRSMAAGDYATAFHFARTARTVPGHARAGAALAVWDEVCARLPRRALLSVWEEGPLQGHEDAVLAVTVDGSGRTAVSGGLDGSVRLWDLAGRRQRLALRGHEGAVTGVALASRGARILSSSRDRTLRLWDVASGASLAVLEGHAETVAGVDVAADAGLRAASAGWDGTVRLWDLRGGTAATVLEGHASNVSAVRFSPDGQVLASAGWDGAVRLWDADTGDPLGSLVAHDGRATSLAWHPSGRQVASGGEDRAIVVADVRSRRRTRVLSGHDGELTGLEFTWDGRFLLSASRDRTVRVWDLRRGESVRALAHPDAVLGLGLNAAGGLLLTAGADRSARVWHLDWEPETEASTRLAASRQPGASATTLREELRAAAPAVAQVPRAAVRAARRVPWRWLGLAALVAASVLVSFYLSWRRPLPHLRLSPLAAGVREEVDLIDLAAFVFRCAPGEYDQHLQAMRSGNPDAHDVACVGARASAAMVSDVLDGAPLSAAEPATARRLRRNAASALTGVDAEAVPALCERLSDPRAEVRATVALALGVLPQAEVNGCLQDVTASGGGPAKAAAASALRQRLARGLMSTEAGWALVTALLHDPAPSARVAALQVVPLFDFGFADPAASALLEDPDPEVSAAAQAARAAIAGARRQEQLAGHSEP